MSKGSLISPGKIWMATAVVAVLGVGAVFGLSYVQAPDGSDFKLAQIVTGPVVSRLRLTGVLGPRRRHNSWFPSAGRVSEVYVSARSSVRRGQPLASLDATQARATVKRRELELSRALLRAKARTPSDTDGDTQSQLAAIDIEQARFELTLARELLDNLVLRAPADGVVIHVGVQPGDSTSGAPTGSVPFVIVEDDEYVVDVEGDEADIRGTKPGAPATVFFSAPDEAVVSGVVHGEPALRRLAATGAAQWGVSIALERNPKGTQVGRTARVEIDLQSRKNVALAPLQAVFRHKGATRVLLAGDGRWRSSPVKVGLSDDHVVELVEGPPPGSVVATGPSERLRQFVSQLEAEQPE